MARARVPCNSTGHQVMAQTPAYQVGLDFGTHASGFSTAVCGTDPRFQELYPDQPEPYCKTLSQLLYSKELSSDWQPVAWGWSAYAQYQSLSASERAEYLLLDRFKLCLAEGYNNAGPCRLPAGLTPVRVIADYLRYLKEFSLKKLSIQWGSRTITAQDVMWALTIPAAWTDSAKQRMRQAAVCAGIVSHPGSRNLMLLYEPEAAALAIIKHPVQPLPLVEGSTFIVVDAGGGTVDVTAHEMIRQDGQLALSELTCRSGVMAGSTNIDDSFQQYVRDLFGPEAFDSWILRHPQMFSKIRHKAWEVAKKTFDGTSGVALDIPGRMLNSLPDGVIERLEAQGWVEDELVVSVEEMQGWFDIVVNDIIRAVRESLNRTLANGKTVDYMLIVGGFGASPYLIAKLRRAFSAQVQEVVCPGVPSQAVLKGAVLYAQSPSSVFARRCKFAYGIECSPSWHMGMPREKMMIEATTQEKLCKDYFDCMVAFDELVEHDQVVEHTFTPRMRFQSAVMFSIHACSNNNDLFITDDSMRRIATLVLPITDFTKVDPPANYKLDVSFSFGSTEFHVVAKDRQTGREIAADVTFIAN